MIIITEEFCKKKKYLKKIVKRSVICKNIPSGVYKSLKTTGITYVMLNSGNLSFFLNILWNIRFLGLQKGFKIKINN